MPEFEYTSIRQMEPRPGRTYATDYYKQTVDEYNLLRAHVYTVAAEIMSERDSNRDTYIWTAEPLKRFKRSTRGQYYSLLDIVTDMVAQLAQHKDIPSGILGRWNRLFEGTRYDILLVSQATDRTTIFQELFDRG
jgi:hypothetical protein